MTTIYGATFPLDVATRSDMASRLSHRSGDTDSSSSQSAASRLFAMGNHTSIAERSGCTVVASGLVIANPTGDDYDNPDCETLAQSLVSAYLSGDLSNLASIEAEFAAVIMDRKRNSIVLVRDRVGTRPLYYTKVGSDFVFASEYKALLAVNEVSREVDEYSLADLHRSKAVPRGRTLFSSIMQVPPASVVELSEGKASTFQYWKPNLFLDAKMSLDDGSQELADLLVLAVSRRQSLGKADDIALALSGGVDSMILLGAAVRAGFRPRTFTIGDSPDDPEIAWAAKIAKHFGTHHTERVLETDDLVRDLPILVWALEDPIARTETLLTLQLCEMAAKTSVNYMIRGDGSDGLFGGMSRHKLLALGGRWKLLARDIWQIYEYTQVGSLPSRPIARLAAETLLKSHSPPLPMKAAGSVTALVVPETMDKELLNRVLVTGLHHSLPTLLQKAERTSSVFGVVPTSPFTDKDILDFAFRVPSCLKHDGKGDKIILRRAARHLIPREFAERPKYPQRVRETHNFCERLKTLAERLSIAEALPDRAPFIRSRVEDLLRLNRAKPWAPEHAMRVWTMILTEVWFRTFVDGDGSQPIVI